MKSFKGKCVVITGAGSGIGRALALKMASEKARLALSDINIESLKETAKLIGPGVDVLIEQVDVSSVTDMERFARLVQEKMNGADVLINNAGVSFTQMIEETAKSDMEWVFGINYWGVVHGCTAFMPQLKSKIEAHIANISSLFGLIPMPTQAAYVASKFAVRGYTESLRIELADTQIGVSCVHPGGVKTNIARNGRHYATPLTSRDPVAAVKAFDKVARLTPDAAAHAIICGIKKRQPRIVVGLDAVILDKIQRINPEFLSTLLIHISRKISKRLARR